MALALQGAPARSLCLLCLLPNVYLCSVPTNEGNEAGGEKGTRGDRRGKGSRASRHHGLQRHKPLLQLGWVYLGTELGAARMGSCFFSPKGDQRRCPHMLCEEAQLNERHWKKSEPLLSGEQSHDCW